MGQRDGFVWPVSHFDDNSTRSDGRGISTFSSQRTLSINECAAPLTLNKYDMKLSENEVQELSHFCSVSKFLKDAFKRYRFSKSKIKASPQ